MSDPEERLSSNTERIHKFVNACANYVFFCRMAKSGAAAIFGKNAGEYFGYKRDDTRDVIFNMLNEMSDSAFASFLDDHTVISELISEYKLSRESHS